MVKYIEREFHPEVLVPGNGEFVLPVEYLTLEVDGDRINGLFDVSSAFQLTTLMKNMNAMEPALKRIISKVLKVDIVSESIMFSIKRVVEINFVLFVDEDKIEQVIEKSSCHM